MKYEHEWARCNYAQYKACKQEGRIPVTIKYIRNGIRTKRRYYVLFDGNYRSYTIPKGIAEILNELRIGRKY